jgi:hypothetical protein
MSRCTGRRARRLARGPCLSLVVLACALAGAPCKPPSPPLAPDPRPALEGPRYAPGAGPAVVFYEAKANVHTLDDLYLPTGELLAWDGYAVAARTAELTAPEDLVDVAVLVIATPTLAFSASELQLLADWVEAGGSLLAVADHPPLAEGLAPLAAAFGVTLWNLGVANERLCGMYWGCVSFAAPDHALAASAQKTGALEASPLTAGLGYVSTFGGAALSGGIPVLTLGPHAVASGSGASVAGLAQGVAVTPGLGRVYVSAEAATFSNRIQGPWETTPTGWDAPWAEYDQSFLLRVIHWLDP